ncbi:MULTISPECIES: 5-formyltetrahydrofolate cyclo-ligase [unclassified Undibacterium]|uniref:5-formyltetrahydrofolate cyclo-ligase n=1 Tax=unclassified Undibacterium TaxID=2630295 RepID=UPI002AC97CEA|nr:MULTISPECIES: 5-formyltetrahydrofolate cyclo-ligase [unclassified Undibacterium]MEB0140332.1 5-formyltetrahydrofolate cyclo-ligase [Undibacterium sp. CCC2.1]MEB0172345.1 5-formyltetrahydrofolate cyclo-ligase [Undibacterium sp. CCC1.1]MEB0176261.1 5-formyltetrahydrofolate cyclo-ligase [Undibacterium sp. CCC3.4]MEB0215499.1 5-formyltetrahydrofolate cyclo-ligase [Undibacterium sp. 5I2]WPX44355.1 5-formyltetrahydrofolate cyclo-ligase [Undibacterium sp. CCC3.4]
MTQPPASAHPQTAEVCTDRKTLRALLVARRHAIAPADRSAWDAQLGQQLLDWCSRTTMRSLAVYWPIQGEPDLRPVYRQLRALGMVLSLPVVRAAGAALDFALWEENAELQVDRYGIAIPPVGATMLVPEALLIPCVGFNARGFRLGYGGGFYDRTLAQWPQATSLGLAYLCLQEEFAAGEYDIAMDQMLTAGSVSAV